MLVAWGAGAPWLPLTLLYFTNCADAALGAFLVRRLSRVEPFRFDGLRTMIVFAAYAATLSTLVLSFADAGISVATGWSGSFHAAFVTRVRSNILTHVILVPAIIDVADIEWIRVRGSRVIEAAALCVLLIVACARSRRRPARASTPPSSTRRCRCCSGPRCGSVPAALAGASCSSPCRRAGTRCTAAGRSRRDRRSRK
jgi:hypothetical protein